MLRLFNKFPRQIANTTRKNVNNLSELLEKVNNYNGISEHIWVSLYNVYFEYTNNTDGGTERHMITDEAEIDKGWFDCDGKRAFYCIRALHAWCGENHFKHIMFFSGGGFHIYILFKNYENLNNPKTALENFHRHVAKTLDLSIGDPNEGDFDIDIHCVGDISRVAGFPGTYNIPRKRYVVSVSDEDLKKGYEHIKEKAKFPHVGEYHWYGKNRYDIKQHDAKEKMEIEYLQVSPEIKSKVKNDEILKELPICVGNLLMRRPKIGYLHRWKIIIYFRDYGIGKGDAIEILKKYMTPKEFMHCVGGGVKDEKMVDRIYRNYGKIHGISFPSCESMRRQGLCPHKTDCVKARLLYK